jgi:hypothetical protein
LFSVQISISPNTNDTPADTESVSTRSYSRPFASTVLSYTPPQISSKAQIVLSFGLSYGLIEVD